MTEVGAAYQAGGNGTAQDFDLAMYWFERSADFSLEAMHQAHVLHRDGSKSRPANISLAKLYLERAARMGHFPSMQLFVQELARAKDWEQAVPFLLRLENKPAMEMFV